MKSICSLQDEDFAKLPWVLLDMGSPWFRLTCAVVFVLEVLVVRCIAHWEINMFIDHINSDIDRMNSEQHVDYQDCIVRCRQEPSKSASDGRFELS
jgi:hypothetical protein